MHNRKFAFILISIGVVLGCFTAQLFAASVVLNEIEITDNDAAVKVLFSASKSLGVECYDLSTPPQIVIDFMGQIYTNQPEVILVNKGVIKQLRVIKGTKQSDELDSSYYAVDFIIVDLKEPMQYDFEQGLTTTVLVVAKPGKLAQAVLTTKKTQVPAEEKKIEPADKTLSLEDKEYEKPVVTKVKAIPVKEEAAVSKKKVKAEKIKKPKVAKKRVPLKKEAKKPKQPKQVKKAAEPKKLEKAAGPKKEKAKKIAKKEPRKKKEKLARKPRRKKEVARKSPKKRKKSTAKADKTSAPEKRVAQAEQAKQEKEETITSLTQQLQSAKSELKEAEQHQQAVLKDLAQVQEGQARLKKDCDYSIDFIEMSKETASTVWREYSQAKADLTKLLETSAEEAAVIAAENKYEQKKTELETAINSVKQVQAESDEKLSIYNKDSQKLAGLLQEAEQSAEKLIQVRTKKDKLEKGLNTAMTEALEAMNELELAQRAVERYKLEKEDQEYQKFIAQLEAEKNQKTEEQKKAKEAAQLEALSRLQKQRTATPPKVTVKKPRKVRPKQALKKEEAKPPKVVPKKKTVKPKRRKTQEAIPPKITPENKREAVLSSAVELRNAGFELQKNGDLAGAIKYFQEALVVDPQYATVHNDLGIIYEQRGLDEKAKMSYLMALKVNPRYIRAHSNLALLYEKLDDYNKAYYHWKQRVELGRPDDPWTLKAKERLKMLEQRK